MGTPPTPSDVARQTLTTLAARKIAPTPENYARVYHEIGGQIPDGDSPPAPDGTSPERPWSSLIHDLLKQLELPHKGITLTRKKEGVETVLSKFSGNPGVLHEKLHALIRSWSDTPVAPNLAGTGDAPTIEAAPLAETGATTKKIPATALSEAEMALQLRELLAQTLESWLTAQPDLEGEIQSLAQQIRMAVDPPQVNRVAEQLRPFWVRLELRGGDKTKIQEGLARLLRLLVENIGELSADDQWLHGQITTLQEIIAQPLDRHTIADAERSLRNAIIKQSALKQSLVDAKTALKSLMATFIDRLGDLTESTSDYHSKIKGYSQKIGQADNLAELNTILDAVMVDTRIIQESALRSHEELLSTRKQAQAAEERVKQLEQQLEEVSEKIHEDHLTGALNRRGLEEALEREIKRSERQNTALCVALLDVDDFKQINDTLGHQAGDLALVHLIKIIKEALRPTDMVARYGGEEFLLVLTDTGLQDAKETLVRLQRELTKRFFLHNNERLLITFSAGVVLRAKGETPEDFIGRADRAMYQAKHTGKNRVITAD